MVFTIKNITITTTNSNAIILEKPSDFQLSVKPLIKNIDAGKTHGHLFNKTTLTDNEVDIQIESVLSNLKSKLKVQQR